MKKMEIRLRPSAEGQIEADMKTILKEYLILLRNKKYNKIDFPLIGIVFHFIKERSKNRVCWDLSNKFETDKYLYYGDIKNKNKELAQDILNLINRIPEISNYIVGIDAASRENNTEPHVFKEIYDLFRTPKKMYNKMATNSKLANTLGFTYHVGEEYRDIMSGLRHIDEVIEHFGYIPGDRIGHGIVLGIDIDQWCAINSTILLPINEYFDNLLWEWSCYNQNKYVIYSSDVSYIENCILDTAKEIFGYIDGITIRDLYEVYQSKFQNPVNNISNDCVEINTEILYSLKNNKKCECNDLTLWNKSKLIKAMNCQYFLENINNKNVSIRMDDARIIKYKKFQEFMQSKLAEKGIIIEVNPTSNILIGDFENNSDFHIENLSSPLKEKMIITINTDDPIIFNTKLSNEYSLVMDFMLRTKKYSRKEILDWIDKIRENGNNFSFIKDRGMTKYQIRKEIKGIISKL